MSRTVSSISDFLCQTSFGIAFPEFVRCVVQPTGGNFHMRMQNSNGKHIISSLLIASLGQCVPVISAYRDIYNRRKIFFSVEMSTHIRGQPHSDPTLNKYTGDVVMMGCCTSSEEAVQWLTTLPALQNC